MQSNFPVFRPEADTPPGESPLNEVSWTENG